MIQRAMQKILEGKTAIIVAHRLSSVIHSDKIFFFHDGKIVASGTHQELLESSSEYRKLVELQFLSVQAI
jgi:ABC-type multidrug transport system fused ATPase/permease subunit